MVFLGISFGCQIQNKVLGNIYELNSEQFIQLNKTDSLHLYINQRIGFEYNNKKIYSNINVIQENDNYRFIFIDQYLQVDNNVFEIYLLTQKEPIILYIFKMIF